MQQAGNSAQPAPLDTSELTEAEKKHTMRKVTWRLVPLLIIGHFISYIDRVNISFAKFGFEDDFNMDAATYGLAAGVLPYSASANS